MLIDRFEQTVSSYDFQTVKLQCSLSKYTIKINVQYCKPRVFLPGQILLSYGSCKTTKGTTLYLI